MVLPVYGGVFGSADFNGRNLSAAGHVPEDLAGEGAGPVLRCRRSDPGWLAVFERAAFERETKRKPPVISITIISSTVVLLLLLLFLGGGVLVLRPPKGNHLSRYRRVSN